MKAAAARLAMENGGSLNQMHRMAAAVAPQKKRGRCQDSCGLFLRRVEKMKPKGLVWFLDRALSKPPVRGDEKSQGLRTIKREAASSRAAAQRSEQWLQNCPGTTWDRRSSG
jgi:hypothetical protein